MPNATYIVGRGPFAESDEQALLSQHRIETVVAKNSGGTATYGKIAAARTLGLTVIMLQTARSARCPNGGSSARRHGLAQS